VNNIFNYKVSEKDLNFKICKGKMKRKNIKIYRLQSARIKQTLCKDIFLKRKI